MTTIDLTNFNDDDVTPYNPDEILDSDFDPIYEDPDLRRTSDRLVDYWEEDYSFDELLEEFDLTTKDAFFALIQTNQISPEDIENFLID